MSIGFEISQDDVLNVLSSYNVEIKDQIDDIMVIIDDDEISEVAMSIDFSEDEDDSEILMKQTEAAYDEIAWQLFQAGFITEGQIDKYGNRLLIERMNNEMKI